LKNELITILELEHIMNNRSDRVLAGQRQKLSILLSLLHVPELLFFDELTTDLARASRR